VVIVRKFSIALMVLGHTVVDSTQNILPVFLPLLQDRFGLNYFQVGVAAALLNVSSSMIQPAFGWMSDRWPTRWFIPAGILWTGVFIGVLGLVPSYWALLGVVVCTGVGTAAFHPIASIAVAHASRGQRGLGMSFFSAGGNLGFALGPIIATWLLAWFDLRGSLVMFVPCLLTATAVFAWRREFEAPTKARVLQPETHGDAPIPWGKLTVLCLLVMLRSWSYSGLVIFLPLLLHEEGAPLEAAARVLFVFLFFGALGGLMGGHLSDRVGRRQVIALSLLAYPFLMTGALWLIGPARWLVLAVAGMTLLASFPVTVVLAQELLPHSLGLASGLMFGLSFGTGGLGVGLSGFMADILGLRESVWILNMLPGIAGLLALKLAPPRRDV
jgi:MFS transporter, FSR family, fosmidomycin resistance protein